MGRCSRLHPVQGVVFVLVPPTDTDSKACHRDVDSGEDKLPNITHLKPGVARKTTKVRAEGCPHRRERKGLDRPRDTARRAGWRVVAETLEAVLVRK